MKDTFYIDHHIQTSILSMLLQDGPQVFSSIKPADIENSLFMYHMNKLISRGMVERSDGNFALTPEGARWLNKVGLGPNPIQEPRCLVQFLVVNNDKILLSERLDHLATHMNRYLLPGGLHRFGSTSYESAISLAENFKLKITGEILTQVEMIIDSDNHHSIADIYLASAPDSYQFKDDFYSIRFMPLSDIQGMDATEAANAPFVVGKYLNKTLASRESMRL